MLQVHAVINSRAIQCIVRMAITVVSRIFRTFCCSNHSDLWYTVICLCLGPLKGAKHYRNITLQPSLSPLVLA